jgi:hypothetical protein
MDSKKTIETFYDSFSKGDALGMQACYHPDIMFQDEVFGKLEGERVFQMWDMLLSSKKKYHSYLLKSFPSRCQGRYCPMGCTIYLWTIKQKSAE